MWQGRTMSFDATQIIQKELEPREKLLWAGQPAQGVKLRGSDIFMIPFSFLWGGFAIFWEYSVIESGAPFFFMLFGVLFVLVGLYVMFGRFYVEAKQRAKTFYGVTNERIVIASGLFRKEVKSLNLRTLTDISLSESSNGSGSISFGNSSPFASIFGGMSWPGMEQHLGPRFDLIRNAKQVYQQIREAQKNAT
jgi:hypothetical protein